MKHDHPEESRFEKFMHWAEGESSELEQELAQDPEHVAFAEYLEYLDSHAHLDFDDYRLMRQREREAKGLPVTEFHAHTAHDDAYVVERHVSHHHPGSLRTVIGVYRGLSLLVAIVLVWAFVQVALEMPAFGDPAAPAVNQVSERYLEQGLEETGAVNAVAGMILDYRAFDTFGESTVLFAATMSVVLLLRGGNRPGRKEARETDRVLGQMGRILIPMVVMFGIYVVLNGHLSPGGGFSGGTVLGCGLILGALVLGEERMEQLFPARRLTQMTVGCLLAYGVIKGYSFFTGANHVGWEVPKGTPGAIFSAGFILPLNICVGIIVACTMYTFYTLFVEREA